MTDILSTVGVKFNQEGDKQVVDINTGEITTVDRIFELQEGDTLKLSTKKQQDAAIRVYKRRELDREVSAWNNELGGFVFVLYKYCNEILNQHKELITADITKLFYLATFVDYTGVLIYDDKPMSRIEMQTKLKMSREKFANFLNKMKAIGIISETNNIKINREYFFKGEVDKEIKKNLGYTRVYVKTIQYLYENVPQRKQGQLGNYFKLIPYIHRQKNVLCHNPDSNKEDVMLMHVRDIQVLLGYNRDGIRSFIREMLSVRLENGEAILGFFRTEYDEGKSYVIVNPKVFYGGNFNLPDGRNAIIKWFSN